MACTVLSVQTAACTSGIGLVRDPIMLRQIMAQLACELSNPTDIVWQGIGLATNTASATIASGSYTPASNALLLAFIANGQPVSLAVSTVVGNGLTWVKVSSATGGGTGGNNIEVWRALGSAPTSGPLTVTFTGVANNSVLRVVQLRGVDTSGTNGSGAIVQAVTATSGAAANPSVTLAAIGGAGRNTVIGVNDTSNGSGSLPESGWLLDASTSGGGNAVLVSVYQNRSTDNTIVITNPGVSGYAIIGLEIRAAT